MSAFGGSVLGQWTDDSWILKGNERLLVAVIFVIAVLVILYYVVVFIADKLKAKEGMSGRLPGEVPYRVNNWMGGEPSQIGQGGVMADPNYAAARDDALVALSRGQALKQGLMGGRGFDVPNFWSADAVNRESQSAQAAKADGAEGFRVNKPLQGMDASGGSALSDAKLQGTLLGQNQLQY